MTSNKQFHLVSLKSSTLRCHLSVLEWLVMRLIQPLLARTLPLPLSPFVHFQSLTTKFSPWNRKLSDRRQRNRPWAFYKSPREGTSEQLRKQNADKIKSHGSHTEKANCWYHSSKDNINTQPVELLLVHLMRPLGLPHAVPSTMADGLGDLSLPPNTYLDAPSLSYTPALTTGFHGTRPGPTEPTTVPDLSTNVSPTCSPVAFKGLGGLCKVKTIFTTIPGCYLPFSLSFSHECTVEFSRDYKSAMTNHPDG